jgi:hypothetical protein
MSDGTYKLTQLELDRVDLVTAGANPGSHVLIHKFDTDATMSDKTAETLDVQPDGVNKHMADDKSVDTVAKADFEALQTQLAEQIAKFEAETEARQAEIAKAAALEETIAKMESERKQAEFVAKAAEFGNLAKADELGALLLAANEAFSAEQYQALERLLKAANAQIESGDLFAQLAKGDADSADVDAIDRVEVLAKAKVEAGTAKTLQIAKLQVLQENRELAAEYSNATRVS